MTENHEGGFFRGHLFDAASRAKLHIFHRQSSKNLLLCRQVRHQFGCIDSIQEVERREVRHCNWVRFLQSTRCVDDVNIVAFRTRQATVYQVQSEFTPLSTL